MAGGFFLHCITGKGDVNGISEEIKTTQSFGCDNAVFEFKKEFLLIHCGWRKAHSLHSCLEPLCMRICMTKLVYWLALMCNTLRFAISQ